MCVCVCVCVCVCERERERERDVEGWGLIFQKNGKIEREKSSLRVKADDFKRNDCEMTLIRGRKGK